MCTITKKDLIDRVATSTGKKRQDVKDFLQTFLEQVIEELGHGNRLEFRDFGVFEVKKRASRTAQNPKTLQPVNVPPKRTVKFKVGRLMKKRLDLVAVTAGAADGGGEGGTIEPIGISRPAGDRPAKGTRRPRFRAADAS